MPGSSDQILDAMSDQRIAARLNALRPPEVTAAQIVERMSEIVSADLGDGHSIAVGLRFAYGQAGMQGGALVDYVTDAQLTAALAAVFAPPAEPEPTTGA